jgi:hypothetical protein
VLWRYQMGEAERTGPRSCGAAVAPHPVAGWTFTKYGGAQPPLRLASCSGGVAGRTTRIGCASACSPSVRGHCIFGSSSHILKAIVMPPRASLLCMFMLFTQPQRQQRLALPPQYAGDATTVHWLAVPDAACTKMLTCFTLSRFQRGPS